MNFKIHDLIFSGQRISSGLECDEIFRVVEGNTLKSLLYFMFSAFCNKKGESEIQYLPFPNPSILRDSKYASCCTVVDGRSAH